MPENQMLENEILDNQIEIYEGFISIIVEEAYKSLRANIQFCEVDNKIKSIAITSCNPGEGKTTTSINIAICMAESGLKVLLVDADMRKPSTYKRLRMKGSDGLSNYLSGYASFDKIISETTIEGLYYLPCGVKPPNPAELIGSEKFTEFLARAEEEFDMVIIDTPPLGSVIDAAVIASKTKGTILVIKSNATDFKLAKRVKVQLEKANARILGVVLNKVSKSNYKNYYNYYGYYNHLQKRKKKIKSKWTNKKRETEE